MFEIATALVVLATLPGPPVLAGASHYIGPAGAPVRSAQDLLVPLSRGWREEAGEEPDARPGGLYDRIVELPGGGACGLGLGASARTGEAQPTRRKGRLELAGGTGFRIEASGRRAGGRWYTGRVRGYHLAVATLGTTVVELSLERFGRKGPDGRLCGRVLDAMARGELRRAVRGARIAAER